MKRLYDRQHEFEAEIMILRADEGGRSSPAFNGIRWDLLYTEDSPEDGRIWMVWPEFVDEAGDALPGHLPLVGRLRARMHVVNADAIAVHRKRIKVGTEFYCVEVPHRVARGRITHFAGLYEET